MWRLIPSVVKARIVNKGRCANSPFPHLIKMKMMVMTIVMVMMMIMTMVMVMMVMIMTMVMVMMVQMRNIHITLVAAQREVIAVTFSEVIKFLFGFSFVAICAF